MCVGGVQNSKLNHRFLQFEWFPFLKSIATRIFIFWLISTLIRNYFGGKQPQQDTTSVSSPSQQKIYPPSFNMFPAGQPFDLYIYLSPSVSLNE